MNTKMKSVGVLLLILLKVVCSEGCWKEEREALLSLNFRIGNRLSWKDGTNCCQWDRVECDTTTGRVVTLNLYRIRDYDKLRHWHLNYSDFMVFKDLKSLDLSDNNIYDCENIEGLKNLEVLDLSDNILANSSNILSCLNGFSSLKSLYLVSNDLNWTSFQAFETLSSKLLHLKVLDISYNDNLTNEILPSLRGFTSLNKLYLSGIGLESDLHVQGLCAKLKNLEVLDMSSNNFNDSVIVSALSSLLSLKSLYLRYTQITPRSIHNISKLRSLEILHLTGNNINLWPQDWSKLKKLEELDLSFNEFTGPLSPYIVNLTSLKTLTLDGNSFTGNIGSNLASLTSLEYLSFEGNQFEFPISFTPFSNHSNIKFIHGDGNKVVLDSHTTPKTWIPKFQLQEISLSSTTESNSIPFPNFLHYQHNLTYLDFSGCKLAGEFPNWLLENNTKMTDLVLKNCSIRGGFQLPSRSHPSMMNLAVSNNAITGQLMGSNFSSIFPNLVSLDMSFNAIHGSIPHNLGHMSSLNSLDLSNNQLGGPMPSIIFSMMRNLEYLSLEGNSFTGSIPVSFFNSSRITQLDISNNHFIGKISSHIKNVSSLTQLRMSNNHFEGPIPSELAELTYLTYLDLSYNNLSGCVPPFVNSFVSFIHMRNNRLRCLPKRMFNENSSLMMLDLSYNEITNDIHGLVHDLGYTELNILLMKANHFTGNIPKQICQAVELTILDLSQNNFSGAIPNCLGKMSFEDKHCRRHPFLDPYDTCNIHQLYLLFPPEKEKAKFTSKKRSETYTGEVLLHMSGIDLSFNKLNGKIPSNIGNLTTIRALNLSHNYLTGKIPTTFSKLINLESLDLSFNMLSDQIPPQLSELNSLEVFTVAHNNLSGATPERKGQFITFDESSYEGNQLLCGPPLPKSCKFNGQPPIILPNGSNIDGNNESWVDMYAFCVSFVVAYTLVLLVIPVVLYINPYWRQAWFYYIELVGMNFYFIQDNMSKFFKY